MVAEDAKTLTSKASTQLAKRKPAKALKLLQKALVLEPDNLFARQRTAEILSRFGHTEAAVREYQHLAGPHHLPDPPERLGSDPSRLPLDLDLPGRSDFGRHRSVAPAPKHPVPFDHLLLMLPPPPRMNPS